MLWRVHKGQGEGLDKEVRDTLPTVSVVFVLCMRH